jgi:hypothetical protein
VWIYIPSEFYPSAQELGESNLDLSWQSQMLEQSVMSKSKPLRARSWQNAWKKKDWIKHLFGQILKPSMASRGVELWIASLVDIPVSHLVLLEKSLAIKTQDISGQISKDSFKKSSHQSASLKMFPTIYELDLKKSQMTYDNWVIKLRQACLQRKKLVLLTKEKDYLSWPTGINLYKLLRIFPQEAWPTITVTDASVMKARSPEKMIRKDGRNTLRNPSLAETILQPQDFPKSKTDLQNKNQGLPYQTKQSWPTVRTSSANGASSKEVEAGNPKQRLEVMITNWATPTNVPIKSPLGHQAPQIMKDGTQSQITLNPRFTEWLMGWPVGWTEFELAETEWCLWLQRMRGELLLMECILQKTIN